MRIGLAEQSVLAALALALVMNEPQDLQKSAEKLQFVINDVTERLKMVYSEVPSYDIVIPRFAARIREGRLVCVWVGGWVGVCLSECLFFSKGPCQLFMLMA